MQAVAQGQEYDGIENVALLGGDGAARTAVGSLLFYCMGRLLGLEAPGGVSRGHLRRQAAP